MSNEDIAPPLPPTIHVPAGHSVNVDYEAARRYVYGDGEEE